MNLFRPVATDRVRSWCKKRMVISRGAGKRGQTTRGVSADAMDMHPAGKIAEDEVPLSFSSARHTALLVLLRDASLPTWQPLL